MIEFHISLVSGFIEINKKFREGFSSLLEIIMSQDEYVLVIIELNGHAES